MIGIIGGTGLYKMEGLTNITSIEVNTPMGQPSAAVTIGDFEGRKVAFLPRHGLAHQILPGEINFRANIWALKSVGVTQIIGVSAVGSLQEEIRPGQLALSSQYLDNTKGGRRATFFGEGLVAHVSTAEPTCARLSKIVKTKSDELGIEMHTNKTYVCVEGPRLGTKAESLFFRQMGCDLVGMTNVPEVFLAREAQLCYCTIAVVTDYDCWLDDASQHVSVDKVIELYHKNIGRVQGLIKNILITTESETDCSCRHALQYALLTDEKNISSGHSHTLAFLRE